MEYAGVMVTVTFSNSQLSHTYMIQDDVVEHALKYPDDTGIEDEIFECYKHWMETQGWLSRMTLTLAENDHSVHDPIDLSDITVGSCEESQMVRKILQMKKEVG